MNHYFSCSFLLSGLLDCKKSKFRCCPDGVTDAQGWNHKGCPGKFKDLYYIYYILYIPQLKYLSVVHFLFILRLQSDPKHLVFSTKYSGKKETAYTTFSLA
jgi:hypothetical protein